MIEMKSDPFHIALSFAMFLVVASVVMLLVQEPGTSGFVLSALSLAVGLTFMGVVAWVIRRLSK
ncbi:MAG: hypothetical protein M1546_16225 [Chloroflexi bacterium]|nr:hypothetical protein [Chloroflexota bacterium]